MARSSFAASCTSTSPRCPRRPTSCRILLDLVTVCLCTERMPECIPFSSEGQPLSVGGRQGAQLGKVALWDVTSGQRITEVGDAVDVVLAAEISPDQKDAALGGPQ